ncbi:MAG: Uma2 family endonuclease [Pseudomonadota bacterium]
MSRAHALQPLTEDEYLRLEESASVKHEFIGGRIHAVAGASERHNRIALNIAFHLRAATRGRSGRAFMADMKLRLDEGPTFYYPDAMLVCDETDDHPIYKRAPCFIAEVLSPATAAIDQREKWAAYRKLPSLRYYLIADSERAGARVFFRDAQDTWYEQELAPEDRLEIACDGARIALTLEDIYEDTGLLAPL